MRRLHRDLIGDAVVGIQPEIGRRLEAAAERDQHALRNVARVESDLGHAVALEVEVQGRQIEHLLHVNIGCTRNFAQPVGDALPNLVIGCGVEAGQLDIDRCGQAEVVFSPPYRLTSTYCSPIPTSNTFVIVDVELLPEGENEEWL